MLTPKHDRPHMTESVHLHRVLEAVRRPHFSTVARNTTVPRRRDAGRDRETRTDIDRESRPSSRQPDGGASAQTFVAGRSGPTRAVLVNLSVNFLIQFRFAKVFCRQKQSRSALFPDEGGIHLSISSQKIEDEVRPAPGASFTLALPPPCGWDLRSNASISDSLRRPVLLSALLGG